MPLYDYKCPMCGKVDVDVLHGIRGGPESCPTCHIDMFRLPTKPNANVFPSEGVFLRHVSATGETFHSKKEMLEYEKKTGCYIDAAH